MEKMKMHSMDIVNDNINKIAQLFPECITEVKNKDNKLEKVIDFDKLKDLFSTSVVEGKKERYQFTWPDKSKAMALVNQPINATLRPCREESVNFDTTENLYIEGDNLDVLKLLRETYYGKIKMIYIDPPYNTGNDFVYKDKFKMPDGSYKLIGGDYDDKGNQLVKNPNSEGKYHTNWLNMMYPRIKLAKDLLSDDGLLFISIDDNEQDNLKKICTEIFGEANFIGCAGRITKKSNNKGDFWAPNFDYILTIAKNKNITHPFLGDANYEAYNKTDSDGPRAGEKYQEVRLYMSSLQNRNPEQRFWITCPDGSKIIPPGKTFPPERPILGDGIWRWTRKKYEEEIDKIVIKKVNSSNLIDENGNKAKWNVYTKTYLNDVINSSSAKPNSFIENHINQNASHELNELEIPFDYAKPTSLIMHLMKIAKVSESDYIMDFFSGSATTAHAIMKLNAEDGGHRKFIMVQLPEKCDEKSEAYKVGYKNICEIGKERIRKAGKKILEENKKDSNDLFADDSSTIDVGFRVLKFDSSNMKDVYYKPEELDQDNLKNLISNIKEGRTSEDLLFQVMLDLGVLLSSNIETMDINGKTVFNVNEGYLMACFDEKVDEETVIEIAKKKPQFFVIRDLSISSDSMMVNFDQIFDRFSPETVRKVI